MKDYWRLIKNVSITEIFRELYPESKIEEEINPNTKNKLYKTFSVFLEHNSKLPQLYFNENGTLGPCYFCFDSGQGGYVPNLLIHKFWEEDLKFPRKSLVYLLSKLNLKLKLGEMKSFVKEFLEQKPFYDAPIQDESLLANNSCALKNGNWVNIWTDKWEGWNKEI